MREFNDKEISLLDEFYSHVKSTKLEREESSGSGEDKWTLSHWTYEVLEQLINGEKKYSLAPVPWYLKTEPGYRSHKWRLWFGRRKLIMLEKLKELKEFYKNILICEVGYGLDILMCMIAGDWEEITCYDHNEFLEKSIIDFFVKRKGLNVKFFASGSNSFEFDRLAKKTIVIANNTHIDVVTSGKKIRENKNILFLHNGVILDPVPETMEECYAIDDEQNVHRGVL